MSREPQPLRFEDAPAALPPADAPRPSREPGALVFASAPAPSDRPAQAPVTARAPAATPPTRQPAPVVFPASPPVAQPPVPGRAAFAAPEHPLKATALAKAAELSPDLAAHDQERLARNVLRLLPFARVTVESWAQHTLDDCRALAQAVADLTAQFTQVQSAQRLSEVLEAQAPPSGLRSRFRRALAPSPAVQQGVVQGLRTELDTVLDAVRKLQPQVVAEGQRLATLHLALRSVAEAAGRPPEAAFERVLTQRLDLMRAALAQMQLLPVQLAALEDTAGPQRAQCDRLLTVTFSALALSSAMQGPAGSGRPFG